MVDPLLLSAGALLTGFALDISRDVIGGEVHRQLVAALSRGRRGDGGLPQNHDLRAASRWALREATRALALGIEGHLGPALPLFDAIRQHFQDGTLAQRTLADVRDTPERTWLHDLKALVSDERAFELLDSRLGTLLHSYGTLTDVITDPSRRNAVHREVLDWLATELGSSAGSRPSALSDFLLEGWPVDDRRHVRVTFFEAWCLFFQMQVKHKPEVFNILVAQTLSGIDRRLAATHDSQDLHGWISKATQNLECWLDQRLDALEAKLDAIGTTQGTLGKQIAAVSTKLEDAAAVLTKSRADVGDAVGDPDEVDLDRDEANAIHLTDEEFLEALRRYSDRLPAELRRAALDDILRSAWEKIVFSPFFARDVERHVLALELGEVARIVLFLCKCALRIPPDHGETGAIIALLWRDVIGTPFSRILLTLRIVRRAAYDHPEALREVEVAQRLELLAQHNTEYLNQFFIDLSLRHRCGYVAAPEYLVDIGTMALRTLSATQSDAPLARLAPFVLEPVKVAEDLNGNAVHTALIPVAQLCRSTIEAKWCVLAYLRVAPLQSTEDFTADGGDKLRDLILAFSVTLFATSPQLQKAYLGSLLRSYARTKNPKLLSDFETTFVARKATLWPPEVLYLQIEYASCLYMLCQHADNDSLEDLTLARCLRAGKQPSALPVFSNPLCGTGRRVAFGKGGPNKGTKGRLFSWLTEYIKHLSSLYAVPLIERNHLRASQFRHVPNVFYARPLYVSATLNSLRRTEPSLREKTPEFAAYSCGVFSLLSPGAYLDLVRPFVLKAVEGTPYALLRNATQIGRALYSWRCYGPAADGEALAAGETFAAATGIGKGEPKFFWIYDAALRMGNATERGFIDSLYEELRKRMPQVVHLLAYEVGFERGLTFPDEVIALIQSETARSLVAQVLGQFLTESEIWNVLGTTLYNRATERTPRDLDQAAMFYSVAKCFARSKLVADQKYCYNYIRCRSEQFQAERGGSAKLLSEILSLFYGSRAPRFLISDVTMPSHSLRCCTLLGHN